MRKLFLFASTNLKKTKGQAVAIIVLILLATIMLNLWLMLATDYKANFYRYHQELNSEHVTFAIRSNDANIHDDIKKIILENEETDEFCLDDCFSADASFEYNGGEVYNNCLFMRKETALTKTVGRVEITEDSNITSGIYLPMLYGTSGNYKIGDEIEIKLNNVTITYQICGFFNSIMLGSHNCSMIALLLTDDQYVAFENQNYGISSILASIRIQDETKNELYESMIKKKISSLYPAISINSNSIDVVSTSRYISQMVCSAILCVMAFLVIIISLAIITSNISNYIQENMKNLGVMKAIGYTSKQLILALLIQFLSITIVATIIGIILSYLVFPLINTMMISQTGIPYLVHFLIGPFALTLFIIVMTVIGAVLISSKRIIKIEPIVALRQGLKIHNFKKNPLPLTKTKLSLNTALALKTTLFNRKQSITSFITMLILSIVVVFAGVMYQNVVADIDPFVDLIVGETSDCMLMINDNKEAEIIKILEQDQRVEKIYLYSSLPVGHLNGSELLATMCDDYEKVNNKSVCFEGRFPKYENEIAIGIKYAKEKKLKLGDEIVLTAEGKEAKFLISGYTQISNYLGKDCLLTKAGYERMASIKNPNYNVNLSKNTDIDDFGKTMKNMLGSDLVEFVNVKIVMDGTASVYVQLITIIVIAIVILSLVVIAFVLYLLVRTLLNNKKTDYGIMKAIGFSTKQLVFQTALSFMPSIIISTIIGIIIGSFLVNSIIGFALNGIGIVKCTFEVPVLLNIFATICLILFAFCFACLLSKKINKIVPKNLLTNE